MLQMKVADAPKVGVVENYFGLLFFLAA